jgi:F0F1-type ATP synthase membrane subunit b/b'
MKFATSIFALGGANLCAATAFAAAGGEAGAGGEGSWSALIFYFINAAIFVALCVHFARPAIRQHFAKRAGDLRDQRARTEAAFEAAEEAAREAARHLQQLAAEKARLREEMEAETAFQIKLLRDTAQTGAARIGRDAELTAAAAVEETRRRVRAYLAGVAGVIARELVQRNFNPDDQRRMLTDFAEKLTAEARP